MAIRKVIRMGHPTLRKVAQDVAPEEIKSKETAQLIQDMIETMNDYDGIGLAAPQINVSKQIAIIEVPEDSSRYPDSEGSQLFIMFNPTITTLTDEVQGFWEGCLSVPDLRGFVERPKKIKVDYTNFEGEKVSMEVEGFLATVFQHELDHLQGELYIDKIKSSKLLSFCQEFDEFYSEEE